MELSEKEYTRYEQGMYAVKRLLETGVGNISQEHALSIFSRNISDLLVGIDLKMIILEDSRIYVEPSLAFKILSNVEGVAF